MKLEKITEQKSRSYDDSCAAAHALDLIGDRWALLVMRELMFGPRRFGDLRASLPGISANVLTQRLEGLEGSGVIVRRKLPPPALTQVYELTEWGRQAEPIILDLGRWGVRSPALMPGMAFSAVSGMLSFRAMFNPARAAGLDLCLGFRFGEEDFSALVRDGAIMCARGAPDAAEVTISGQPMKVILATYGVEPLTNLEARGEVVVAGDRNAFLRFAGIFELPPKAV